MNGNTKNTMEDYMSISLSQQDPDLFNMIEKEKNRQICGLEMIASENFTSTAVQECLSSCLTNKYSEGMVGRRYYGGNEFIDEIEKLCMDRALQVFKLNSNEWGVNVQPYSGSPANFEVYTGLLNPGDTIMGLDLPDGGHLTHGFHTPSKKVSASSIFFQSVPYKGDHTTGLIDYDALEERVKTVKPKLIIAGISCYPRHLDYKRFRQICDSCGAILMADMAHVSGLVAAGVAPSPFQYADIVTTTTHKTLRGPRSGIIFFRKGENYNYESRINEAVFPGLQGGPHNHQIAGVAVALKQAMTDSFVKYQIKVVSNARALCRELSKNGCTIVTDGTDTHIVWVDMRSLKLSGGKAEKILEEVSIACNKNTVPGDKSALNPSGIRLGTPALTTRGLGEEDMTVVAGFIINAFNIAKNVQEKSGLKLVDFKRVLSEEFSEEVKELREQVEKYAKTFPMPGKVGI